MAPGPRNKARRPHRRRRPRQGGGEGQPAGGNVLSRRQPPQRWRRRLETGDWRGGGLGRGGSAGEREGRSGGWEVGPAGGRAAAAAAGVSGAPGCGADAAPSYPQRSRARPPEPRPRAPRPEPRASASASSRFPVPGHAAAATAGKAAGAEQVASAPLRLGKVSPAAVGGSWRGVWLLLLEGRRLRTSGPCVRPGAAPPGTWRPQGRSPRRLLDTVGDRDGMGEGSQNGPGEAQKPSST